MAVGSDLVGSSQNFERIGRWARKNGVWIAYLFVLVLIVFLLRRETIVSVSVLNPDEAELLAGGKRAALSLIPFDQYSTGTYGPFWPTLMGILARLGFPMSLPFAHFLSFVCASTVCVSLAMLIGRNLGRVAAVLIVTPLALQWAQAPGDYQSLSTELLPLVLLSFGLLIGFSKSTTIGRVAFSAVILGMVPWAKFTFAPIALVAIACLAFRLYRSGRSWKFSLGLAAGCALSVSVLFILIADLAGVPQWKIFESFRFTIDYMRGGGFDTPGMDKSLRVRLTGLGSILISFTSILGLFAVIVGLLPIHGLREFGPAESKLQLVVNFFKSNALRVGAAVVMIGSFISLLASYPYYPHYNYLLVAGAIAGIALASGAIVDEEVDLRKLLGETSLRSLFWSGVVIVSIFGLLLVNVFNPMNKTTRRVSLAGVFDSSAATYERLWSADGVPLSEVCPSGSKVWVWGWSPEYYSTHDWLPASRYVTTVGAMAGNSLHVDHVIYQNRLREELNDSKVDCIVDLANANAFGVLSNGDQLKYQMPDLWQSFSEDHQEMTFYLDHVEPISVLVPRMD